MNLRLGGFERITKKKEKALFCFVVVPWYQGKTSAREKALEIFIQCECWVFLESDRDIFIFRKHSKSMKHEKTLNCRLP